MSEMTIETPIEFREILQRDLPYRPWQQDKTRRLPGIQPLAPEDWILVDEAFDAQMAYRDWLITHRRDQVFGAMAAFDEAVAAELLAVLAQHLKSVSGYAVGEDVIARPDGVAVSLASDHPLVIAARLVQNDLVIMERQGDADVLSAAVLCFPASWSLSEKLGRDMGGIHEPVSDYDDALERRVTRLFDAIRVEQPLWRANYLSYEDPDLFQPRTEDNRRHRGGDFMRVERQTLRRLPASGAVIFGIHSFVVPMQPDWQAELDAFGGTPAQL
ncbi:MAG: DUF3445 domain-containing protein [Pseudomonadota bacterium]